MSWIAKLRKNPVVLKELRGRMRGRRAFVVLTAYLMVLSGGISLAFLPLANRSLASGYDLALRQYVGKGIFGLAVLLQFITISFIAPGITAGAIASEREHQTLDILRTTLLSARDLVTGKLMAALSFLFLLLLAAFPIQSLAFLMGGVELEEIVVAAVMLITATVALSAVGVFFSSVLKRTLASTVLAYAVSFLTVAGLPMLLMLLLTIASPVVEFLFMGSSGDLSPVTAVVLLVIAWILVSSNPLIAALATEAILVDSQSLWYYLIPLPSSTQFPNPSDLPVPSPWIGYVLGNLLLSAVLIRVSIRAVRRPEA